MFVGVAVCNRAGLDEGKMAAVGSAPVELSRLLGASSSPSSLSSIEMDASVGTAIELRRGSSEFGLKGGGFWAGDGAEGVTAGTGTARVSGSGEDESGLKVVRAGAGKGTAGGGVGEGVGGVGGEG